MMFVIAFFSVRSPRHGSIGMVSLIAYLIALISKQLAEPCRCDCWSSSPPTVTALVRCVLIPERPEAVISACAMPCVADRQGPCAPRSRGGSRRVDRHERRAAAPDLSWMK